MMPMETGICPLEEEQDDCSFYKKNWLNFRLYYGIIRGPLFGSERAVGSDLMYLMPLPAAISYRYSYLNSKDKQLFLKPNKIH